MVALEPRVRELAQDANFAALTVNLRRRSMTRVMWSTPTTITSDQHRGASREVRRRQARPR
jgi:hypothetical protein